MKKKENLKLKPINLSQGNIEGYINGLGAVNAAEILRLSSNSLPGRGLSSPMEGNPLGKWICTLSSWGFGKNGCFYALYDCVDGIHHGTINYLCGVMHAHIFD